MCTRILLNRHSPFLVARTMDWPGSTDPLLAVLPAGLARDGSVMAGQRVTEGAGHTWTSTYGSVVTTMYGVGTAEVVNEQGLAVHLLYLEGTDFGRRDPSVPAVHAGLWPQLVLERAATVEEALAVLEGIAVVMVSAAGYDATVHLAIEDATGDSAVIEYLGNGPEIHHDRAQTVLTNEPPFAEQRELLRAQDFSRPSDALDLPGNVNPVARFQRAAYFADLLPKPESARQAVAGAPAIARNVSIPFGAPYEGFGLYNTEYRTVIDLEARRYFFERSTSPNVIWVDLDQLDFSPSADARTLDPGDIDLSGEVSSRFASSAPAI